MKATRALIFARNSGIKRWVTILSTQGAFCRDIPGVYLSGIAMTIFFVIALALGKNLFPQMLPPVNNISLKCGASPLCGLASAVAAIRTPDVNAALEEGGRRQLPQRQPCGFRSIISIDQIEIEHEIVRVNMNNSPDNLNCTRRIPLAPK